MGKNTVMIHGREYKTVAGRVGDAHEDKNNKTISITTEVLTHEPVLVKATVVTHKGTYTGHSAANPTKSIEKMNPYEVAETSAVGRALGFAGYGLTDSIATADEMKKANGQASAKAQPTSTEGDVMRASKPQLSLISILLTQKGHTKEEVYKKYGVTSLSDLSKKQASTIIENLNKLPSVRKEEPEKPQEEQTHEQA